MKIALLMLMMYGLVWSSSINLNQLLQNVQEEHPTFKAAQEQIKSQHMKHEAEFSTTPLSLFTTLANATPAVGKDNIEYSVGIEKELRLGNIAHYASQMGHYEHEAMEFVAQRNLLILQNKLKRDYHLSCIKKETISNYEKLYNQFEIIYTKKQTAFNYGELSKKELLQLELEKERLTQKINSLVANERVIRHKVLSQARLETSSELFCQDLLPLKEFSTLLEESYPLSKEIYNNLNLSSDNALKRYNSSFDSIGVALYYDNETDMERVGVDISIPLTFTSDNYEKMRLSALHEKQKLTFEKEALYLNKKVRSSALKEKVNTFFKQYGTIDKRLTKYKTELMPLIEKSYRLNESSLIEYLLTYENFNEMNEELNHAKKAYYQTLFELYSVLEIKE